MVGSFHDSWNFRFGARTLKLPECQNHGNQGKGGAVCERLVKIISGLASHSHPASALHVSSSISLSVETSRARASYTTVSDCSSRLSILHYAPHTTPGHRRLSRTLACLGGYFANSGAVPKATVSLVLQAQSQLHFGAASAA